MTNSTQKSGAETLTEFEKSYLKGCYPIVRVVYIYEDGISGWIQLAYDELLRLQLIEMGKDMQAHAEEIIKWEEQERLKKIGNNL